MNFKYEQLQRDLRILREQRQLTFSDSEREKELDLNILSVEEAIDRIESDARDLAEAMLENS